MKPQFPYIRTIWVLKDDIEGAPMQMRRMRCETFETMDSGISTQRASRAFTCVEVHIDGTRFGENGTCIHERESI